MTVKLDNLDPDQKRKYVLIGVTIGLVLAIASTALRVWAKLMSTKKLKSEDYFMGAALFMCIGTASCMYYGLTTGLGQHRDTLTKPQIRHFLISLWVIQRLQPLSLFCVKTSIIIFYVRIFPTKAIWVAGWAIWVYTLLWLIGVWFATLFECHPISYFWNKTIEGGHCIANPLITIGLTSAVLSCVGDMFIFGMPIPVVLSLNVNTRKKIALAAIFAVGLFVITTSFVRWVAILTTKSDLTSNQVEAGVWTFLEISIGTTCGNLPLLTPLVRSCFSPGTDTTRGYHGTTDKRQSTLYAPPPNLASPRSTVKRASRLYPDLTTLEDSMSGSEVELRDRVNEDTEDQERSFNNRYSVGASSNGLGPEVLGNEVGLGPEEPAVVVPAMVVPAIVVPATVDVHYNEPDEQRSFIIEGIGADTMDDSIHCHGDVP